MKPAKTKQQMRAELEAQMESFLASGGNVDNREMGESGRTDPRMQLPPAPFDGQSQPRTQVNEVVEAIEQRRKSKGQSQKPASKKPRKKLILDDFGEPLRWEWEE